MPPRGHYLAHEVGALAGVSGDRVGQWARRGYIRASQDSGIPHVYSYQDVGEAMVVHELVEQGAELKSIKRAIERLRELYGHDWPLQHAELGALHGSVVGFDEHGAYDIGGKGSPWQHVVEPDNLRKIASQLERGGWVVRELPDLRYIEVNPDRLSGRPAIRGKRVPASMVAELADRPDGPEILREDFDLSDDEIRDARRWWSAASRFDEAA
jgi:uncharacterized protein (DUF433 family)